MFDVFAAPIGLEAGRTLALSAMPNAPVVADRRARKSGRPRLRAALAHRLAVRFQAA